VLDALSADPRVTVRRGGSPDPDGTAVVYWMQRAQRASDNPALDLAIDLGNLLGRPVVVFFGLFPFITRANLRHYRFLADGLPDIAEGLCRRRVGFVLRRHPHHGLLPFLEEVRPAIVVGDENPLRQTAAWRETVAGRLRVPLWTVDADVVVPSVLLEKEQYAARTIRPRLHARLNDFLVASGEPMARVRWWAPDGMEAIEPTPAAVEGLPIARDAEPVADLRGGSKEGHRRLARFLRRGLAGYGERRNDPTEDGTSALSPYLHFGHLGPREVALAVRASGAPAGAVDAFIEQLVVRRELAVNFVRFNPRYDALAGCEDWARRALREHRRDRRPHLYTERQFEAAETHDPLWNAAQRQMVTTGWMHGYVRMYWAKKILEWSRSAEQALETAVRLNDRYQMDGRDPSGYANIAWAIGGKHDRPWPPRPVFGTVRSMTEAGMKRKFDVARYVAQHA